MTELSEYLRPGGPLARPVLASLNRGDYEAARRRSKYFARWADYDEFLAERDALHVGYGCAGVEAKIQRVRFEAFERWSLLTGAPFTIDALDEFAAHWRWRARRPKAPVQGRLGVPDDPERNEIAAAGVQRVLILPELYVRWRDDLSRSRLIAAPDLDAYAAHVVECCLPSKTRSRRSAVEAG